MHRTHNLTPKQIELKRALISSERENGYIPSYDELAEKLGYASKSGIHRLMSALEERGHVSRLPNKSRAIKILDYNLPGAAVPVSEPKPYAYEIPFLGKVSDLGKRLKKSRYAA